MARLEQILHWVEEMHPDRVHVETVTQLQSLLESDLQREPPQGRRRARTSAYFRGCWSQVNATLSGSRKDQRGVKVAPVLSGLLAHPFRAGGWHRFLPADEMPPERTSEVNSQLVNMSAKASNADVVMKPRALNSLETSLIGQTYSLNQLELTNAASNASLAMVREILHTIPGWSDLPQASKVETLLHRTGNFNLETDRAFRRTQQAAITALANLRLMRRDAVLATLPSDLPFPHANVLRTSSLDDSTNREGRRTLFPDKEVEAAAKALVEDRQARGMASVVRKGQPPQKKQKQSGGGTQSQGKTQQEPKTKPRKRTRKRTKKGHKPKPPQGGKGS